MTDERMQGAENGAGDIGIYFIAGGGSSMNFYYIH